MPLFVAPYLNNIVEQDHRSTKRRVNASSALERRPHRAMTSTVRRASYVLMQGGLSLSSIFCAGLAVAASTLVCRAEDATFRFESLSPQHYTSAYLGNGAIGLETTPLATTPSRCFVAGVYDETPGDVPRIASAPAWNEVDVYNGSHWLNGAELVRDLENYRQILDMYDGVLRTSYVWAEDNRRIRVFVEQFVSRNRADSAAVRVVLTPEFAGEIKVRLPLRNWTPPKRYALARIEKLDSAAEKDPRLISYPGYLQVIEIDARISSGYALLSLVAHAPGTSLQIGEAVAAQWSSADAAMVHKESEGASVEVTLTARSGTSYTFTKFAVLKTPAAASSGREMAVPAVATLTREGWDTMLAQHSAAWHRLWQCDIVLDGNASLQRTIHSMLFYLLGSVREDLNISTAPMGLSSAAYYGHIFWDADTFMFPPLLILHPELARPIVAFRSRTREPARKNAKANRFQGAMYPWEAGPRGEETTPRFASQNAKYENHINGDVALAAWQYWVATRDRGWLERDCWPILRDTADFWVSRVSYNVKRKRYEIGKVVAVNESLIGVDNDAWTNAIARKNLELATAAARELDRQPNPKWREVADAMYIPETDSALLRFPLAMNFTREQTLRAVESMLNSIRRGETGAMMGGEFYPILAAELGDQKLIGQMLAPLSTAYLRSPFQVIAETPSNQSTNFITGAGAFLQQFVFGYPGLRLTENGVERKFASVLPSGIKRLTLKNITVRGKRQTLIFMSNGH
jgi:protein-glucosylgalactosylhydroxylysine glucosidase